MENCKMNNKIIFKEYNSTLEALTSKKFCIQTKQISNAIAIMSANEMFAASDI